MSIFPQKLPKKEAQTSKAFDSSLEIAAAMTGRPPNSVTRFGEILLLGQTFKNLLQTFEGLFSVWQNFEPTLATFDQFWGNLSC